MLQKSCKWVIPSPPFANSISHNGRRRNNRAVDGRGGKRGKKRRAENRVGHEWFLLYLAFVMAVSLVAGMIVNVVI